MLSWLTDNSGILVAELIGAVGTIIAVVITIKHENRQRREDLVSMAKPIIINYLNDTVIGNPLPTFVFQSDTLDSDEIIGSFKNTDNGILFLDHIDIGSKRYNPKEFAVVDKNTTFSVLLQGTGGASFDNSIKLYCHDIFGNQYWYRCEIANTTNKYNDLILSDGKPQTSKGSKKR